MDVKGGMKFFLKKNALPEIADVVPGGAGWTRGRGGADSIAVMISKKSRTPRPSERRRNAAESDGQRYDGSGRNPGANSRR